MVLALDSESATLSSLATAAQRGFRGIAKGFSYTAFQGQHTRCFRRSKKMVALIEDFAGEDFAGCRFNLFLKI